MIIFTITNRITNQVYVGNTRNDLFDQWQKIIAAAGQQLDYPLYKDIRVHGADSFAVELFDHVDTREELAEVEHDAITRLNARSLKGYKTTTACISTKTRPKKNRSVSTLEKELASLHVGDSDFDDADDETPLPEPDLSNITDDTQAEKPQGRRIKTEAADAVLTGDITVTDSLTGPAAKPKEEEPDIDVSVKPSLSNDSRPLSGKEKRILKAIERHRQASASRTSAEMDEEKEKTSQLLTDLNDRAYSLSGIAAHQ